LCQTPVDENVALAKGGLYRLSRHETVWKIHGCYEGTLQNGSAVRLMIFPSM